MVDWIESSAKINPDGTSADADGKSFVMQQGAPTQGDYLKKAKANLKKQK